MVKKTFIVSLMCAVIAQGAFGALMTLTDDTWVREDSADTNRNGDDQTNARTDADGDRNDVVFLRFDTSSWTDTATAATLTMFWYRDDTSSDKTLALYGLNETDAQEATWSESVVTYNTAPGMISDGVITGDETLAGNTWDDVRDLDAANLTLLVAPQSYGPQVTDDPYTFTGSALADFINADSNGQVTFLIVRGDESTSSNQARFQTKEAGLGATLDVIPEPATVSLFGVFGAAVFFMRRNSRR